MPIQAFSNFLLRLYKDSIVLIFTGILLLSGSQALALEITAVGLGNDAFEGQLMIMGSGFDTGITPPMVYIDEYPYPLSVIAYDSNHITAVFSLFSLADYLDPSTEDALTINLTVAIYSNETIEYEGAEIVVPKIETAEYCFDIETDGTIVACGEGTGPLVPMTRQVDWRLPNDPEGNTCVDYAYKFGPVKINSSDNKRGDPVYYQSLHDYEINLKQYLEDYDKNNFGDTLLDRCEDALNPLLERLEALAYKGWPDTNPVGDTPFMAFGSDGTLFIKKGYRWDGPTLDFAGSRILAKPSSLIRASMVHDAIYDLMRMHLIDYDNVRIATSKAWYNRKLADCMIYMLSRQDHNTHKKAKKDFNTIRTFGAAKTKDSVPDWKYHATADAGSYEPVSCAANTGYDFELNGENSNDALTYEWEITDSGGAAVTTASGPKPEVLLMPGNYTATLTVDDGDDGDINDLYRDSDKAEITIAADTEPPVFLLAEDITVPMDPGQCSAMVDLKVIASDDCGTPDISCARASDNNPVPVASESQFPVGTTEVICEAADDNQNSLANFTVTVVDTEPPTIKGNKTPIRIWPPNHRYARVRIADLVSSISDNCSGVTLADARIVRVTSDEADDAKGKGKDMGMAGYTLSMLRSTTTPATPRPLPVKSMWSTQD